MRMWLFALVLGSWLPVSGSAQVTLPTATINVGVTPATTLTTGQVVTVTVRIASYSGPIESDGFGFTVEYDPSLLTFVPDSLTGGLTNTGADQQWLGKAAG